jgi:hypothetical protein
MNCTQCGAAFQRSRPDGNREKHCSLFCRWLSYVAAADENGCWNWIGAVASNGYGALRAAGRTLSAHRLALTFKLGREPEGKTLHSCDNRLCCNPAHLRKGSDADNVADMMVRKRHHWFRWSEQEKRAWVSKIVSCQPR